MPKKQASQPETAPAAPASYGAPAMPPGPAEGFKRKADLTPTIISLAHTAHIYVEVLGPVEKHAMPGVARSEDGTVPILRVRDLQTGAVGMLLCTTVLLSVLDRVGDVVGKRLEIVATDPREGKNYRDVRVWEIE